MFIPNCPRANHVRSYGTATLLVIGIPQSNLGSELLELWRLDTQYKDATIVAGNFQISLHAVVATARGLQLQDGACVRVSTPLASEAPLLLLVEYLYTDRVTMPGEHGEALHALAVELSLPRLAAQTQPLVDLATIPEGTLAADLSSMVGDARWSDFEVAVEDEEGETEVLACHKCMLVRCDYFKQLLSSGLAEASSSRVTIHCNRNGLRWALRYVYSGAIDDATGDDCVDTLAAADRLLLPRLKELMEITLQQGIDETTVGFMFEVAERAASQSLMSVCIDFARHHLEEVMGAGSLDNMDPAACARFRRELAKKS